MPLVHGTCIEIKGCAVLIRGPSGSGKSDLAYRLIEKGARLIADDQTILEPIKNVAIASCPASISGLIEVRGIGIIQVPLSPKAPLGLVIDLVARTDVPRLPAPETWIPFGDIPSLHIPIYCLHAFDASTPNKVRLAVNVIQGKIGLET